MSKTGRINHRRGTRGIPKVERRLVVRGVRKDQPDLRAFGRAVIAIALRDIEAGEALQSARSTPRPAGGRR